MGERENPSAVAGAYPVRPAGPKGTLIGRRPSMADLQAALSEAVKLNRSIAQFR